MDGTLYQFDSIIFYWSSLQRTIKSNIISLLENLWEKNSTQKYAQIEQDYGEDFSLAFEYIYGMPKEEYFSYVWDLEPKDHIHCIENIPSIFKSISDTWNKIYILSDAPTIWINRVILFLWVHSYITKVYSGEWSERKSNWALYQKIQTEIQGEKIMIGDQEQSDVLLAKENWFQTIYISYKWLKSKHAKRNISKLEQLLVY